MTKVRKMLWLVRFTKPKQIFLFLSVFVVILILYFSSLQNNKCPLQQFLKGDRYYEFSNMHSYIKDSKFDGEKLVHLDLKGAPPKVSYYKKLFPLLSKLGATGIFIEYEDMFPYRGPILANVSALNAYSLADIKTILQYAEESRLTVIPLIQTFGHMEFALKMKDFEYLREVPEYPQVICPTHKKTLTVVMEIVHQIIRAHPNITKIHIGADEAWFIGACVRCTSIMTKFGWTKKQLFLEHVSAIAHNIRNRYPHLRILMWDDEFRSMSLKELKASQINSLIEPVVSKYTRHVYEDLGPNLWDMYAEVFPRIWIASAFKGTTGSNQYVTDINHHLQNHRSWMNIVSEYKRKVKFEGIFITGWQRYDHFAVLCELLPVAIPSLAMSLRLLLGYNESPLNHLIEIAKILQCEQLHRIIDHTLGLPKCAYPGGDVLEVVLMFHQLKEDYSHVLDDDRIKGWMTNYNIEQGFSNRRKVEWGAASLSNIKLKLLQVELGLFTAMQEVYDNYTITEWRDTYIKPFASQVHKMWNAKEKILAKRYWPRRPFNLHSMNEP